MNIDELIKDSIEDAAGQAPPPDLNRIHSNGRRRSAARVGSAALATLAVVAAGTYAVQGIGGSGDSDSVPAAIATQGPAMAFATYNPTTVHMAGESVEPGHRTTLNAATMTSAGVVYISGDSNGTPYLLTASGEEKRIGDSVDPEGKPAWASEVVSDVEGTSAAWQQDVAGPQVRINLFDAGSQKVTASVDLDPAEVAGDASARIWLQTIHEGVVYGWFERSGERSQSFAWDPSRPQGEQVYATTDPGTIVAAVGNQRLVLKGTGEVYGGPDRAPVDKSTRVTRLPGKNLDRGVGVKSSTLSPDGDWALVDPDPINDSGYPSDGGDADSFDEPNADWSAMNLDTGKLYSFGSQGIVNATFDDDGSVLMIEVTPDGGDRLSDCALPSLQCTTVLDDVPDGGGSGDDSHPVANFVNWAG